MKQKITFTLAILLLAGMSVFAQQIQMPQASPSAKIAQKVGLTDVTVDYSRPSTKGRKIFGELVPFGEVWRTGANGATIISFSTDVEIDGKKVPQGQYALYAIPGKSEWTIILSKDTKLWGAIGYDPKNDLMRFQVEPSKLSRVYETFEISFNNMTDNGADLSIKWEQTRVDFRIVTQVDAIVMAQIKELVIDKNATDPTLLYSAASYYFTNQKDIPMAYTWITKSVESDPKYWTVHLKAKIELALGMKTEALESAKKSKELAIEAKNPDYVSLNDRLIKSIK
ncbi:MAG: DUF2911 domain-containing protein [Algoriphagus sp.]|nr:DUF2911 domain-containing protein [Algoriphagus sp.]